MATWNVINRTDFHSHSNIMAEHYQIERIDNENQLKKLSTYKIGDLFRQIIQLINPSKLNSCYNVFDLSDSISNFLTTDAHFVPSSSTKKISQKDDFIISRLRYYLKEMAIVPDSKYKTALSTEYLVYRSKTNISAKVLLPFALSSYVQSILKWAQMGNEHPRFASETFEGIYLPDIVVNNAKEITSYIEQAIYNHKQSTILYRQAEELLTKELQLDKLKLPKNKWYTAQYSEVVEKKRVDAEFYNQNLKYYYDFFSSIPSIELKEITEFADVKKFSNPDYANIGVPIITQKHLSQISPEKYGDFPIASKQWCNKNKDAILRTDDLLFYSVGAYLGKTNIWLNDDEAVFASFITLLRCKENIDSCFLMLLLNSTYGTLQSKVFQSGTSQPYIYPKDIKQFLIPDIKTEIKQELYNLIHDSYNAKRQSQVLLARAKSRVEELIEQETNKK